MTIGRNFQWKHTYVYLLSAPLLLSIYYYHQNDNWYLNLFPAITQSVGPSLASQYFKFVLFFLLLGVIPFLYLVLVVRKPLSEFGLSFGNYRLGLKLVFILIPFVIAPLMWLAAKMPDIQAEYPMARILLQDDSMFLQYELLYILCYYIAWEFFFRGFLLFGLMKDTGLINAILIQTISSCLIHLGKPEGETIGSIATGIIFGYIAYRTNSIWYVWILHFSIGLLTDYFVILQT